MATISINAADSSALRSIGVRIGRVLNPLIYVCLLILIVLTAIPYGTVDPLSEAIFECAIFALGVLWIIEGYLSGSWRLEKLSLLAPMLALAALAFLQTLPLFTQDGTRVSRALSADQYETWLFIYKLLALILTLELLLRYTDSRRRLRALIYVVIGVCVASAAFGILRQALQQQPGGDGFLASYLKKGEGYGQFVNRNHFAFLMEMGLGLALGLIVRGGVRRDRALIFLAVAVLLWTALVLSNTRAGIFSMLCQLLFIGLLLSLTRSVRTTDAEKARAKKSAHWRVDRFFAARIILVVCLVAAVSGMVVWIGGDPLANRIQGDASAEEPSPRSNTDRVDIWRATWHLIKDHPIAGVGFGGYLASIGQYHDASGVLTPHQAHNDYLELLAGGGIIGGAIGIWFVLALIKNLRARLRLTDSLRRAACFGALAGIFAVAVHSFVDFGLHITLNALVLVALIAIATTDISGEDKRAHSEV